MTADEIRARLDGGEILLVPYTHCDWAWTHTREWHARRYVLVFEEVLERMRTDPDFRWYLDTWITELQPFLDRRPDLVPELQARIREGRIAICGAFSNVRPNMVGEETFIRNLIHGRRRFRSLFPDADLSVHADIVDVALGHPQMPQVLTLGGYRYYRCWRPQAALSVKGIPYEFVWEGLDGTRILCSRGAYGALYIPQNFPEGFRQNWDEALQHLWTHELELVARHSPTRLIWLSIGCDDSRFFLSHCDLAELDVPGLVRAWNEHESVPMRFATPVEFYRRLEERSEQIPVVSGTLDPCDVCYNAAYAGGSGLWRLRLQADQELSLAEAWQVAAPAGPDPTERLTALWENLLLFSAHATQWLFQQDFDDLHALARQTCREAASIRRRALEGIARRVPQTTHTAAVVFNSLPFAREVVVPVLLTDAKGIPEHVRLLDGAGREVPHQITNRLEIGRLWEYEAVAHVALPAFGYTTLRWEAAEAPPGAAAPCMDNGLLSLRFDGGHLTQVSTPEGEYPAPDGLPWSLLRVHHVGPGPLHVGEIECTEDVRWHEAQIVESGPVRWRHVASGQIGPHPVTLETLLHAGEARAEFRMALDWRGAPGNAFVAVLWPIPAAASLVADVPFGKEAKNLDVEPYGLIPGHLTENQERLREGMFFARSYVRASDGVRGVTYVTHDGDRYYIHDRRAGALAHILVNSIRHVPEGWEKDICRQREAIGRHAFSWSLLFHGREAPPAMARLSASLRTPPEVLLATGAPAPDLPEHASLVSVSPDNVVLSALYADGRAVTLRVWESEGRPAEVDVQLPFAPLTATRVDFNGEALGEPAPSLEGRCLRFAVRPWEIATVKLGQAPAAPTLGG